MPEEIRYCALPSCGKVLTRKYKEAEKDFLARKYCNSVCWGEQRSILNSPPLTREEFIALKESGKSDHDIAKELGYARDAIARLRVHYGIPHNTRGQGKIVNPKSSQKYREIGNQIARAQVAASRAGKIKATSFESIESFLARGGTITKCEPNIAFGFSCGQSHVVPFASNPNKRKWAA